jgi:hypothetical protein
VLFPYQFGGIPIADAAIFWAGKDDGIIAEKKAHCIDEENKNK